MSQPKLTVTDFTGTVVLRDWIAHPDGRSYIGFYGQVSIMRDEEAVGFKSEGHNNANWIARIEGPTQSVNVLGCQVRAVYEGDGVQPQQSDFMTVP